MNLTTGKSWLCLWVQGSYLFAWTVSKHQSEQEGSHMSYIGQRAVQFRVKAGGCIADVSKLGVLDFGLSVWWRALEYKLQRPGPSKQGCRNLRPKLQESCT